MRRRRSVRAFWTALLAAFTLLLMPVAGATAHAAYAVALAQAHTDTHNDHAGDVAWPTSSQHADLHKDFARHGKADHCHDQPLAPRCTAVVHMQRMIDWVTSDGRMIPSSPSFRRERPPRA